MDTNLILLIVAVAAVAVIAVVIVARTRQRSDRSRPSSGASSPSATRAAPTPSPPRTLRDRLARSRSTLAGSLAGVFGRDSLDDTVWDEMEEALIAADVGPGTATDVVARVRRSAPATGAEARVALTEELERIMERSDRELRMNGSPAVVVVVGVNGTGKTTSIAKIAHRSVSDGRSVVLGAADTFRAAADTQLRTWGERVGVPVVAGDPGADPASVAFEAYREAVRDGADVVIVDTAGRLHSQANLMDELAKIVRVLEREAGSVDEVLLVLDGTVGQNGLAQAHAFTSAVGVTGLVLTKLDGTARGGVAVAVEQDLDIPVKLIGVGEAMDDLIAFDPVAFVEALVAE